MHVVPNGTQTVAQVARGISSTAFSGPDGKTAYMGNLLDDKIYCFPVPEAGAPPSHWLVRMCAARMIQTKNCGRLCKG